MSERAKVKKSGVALTVWVSHEDIARIEELAEKMGLSRSKFVVNLIKSGLDDVKLMDKTGLLAVAVAIRDANEKLQACMANLEGGQADARA